MFSYIISEFYCFLLSFDLLSRANADHPKPVLQSLLVKWTTGCYISGCVLSMGNAMKTLAQHLHRCALDRPGCVSISGVRTSLCIGLANPLRSSCNARNATFYNTAMGLIAISFLEFFSKLNVPAPKK
jgi:hypothetical protein